MVLVRPISIVCVICEGYIYSVCTLFNAPLGSSNLSHHQSFNSLLHRGRSWYVCNATFVTTVSKRYNLLVNYMYMRMTWGWHGVSGPPWSTMAMGLLVVDDWNQSAQPCQMSLFLSYYIMICYVIISLGFEEIRILYWSPIRNCVISNWRPT